MATGTAMTPLAGDELARRRMVVIGGGVMGLATADAAARLGGDRVRVTLVEAASVAHEGGASVDVTRVFRHVYGEQALYTRWMVDTLPLWRELEQRSARQLVDQCGCLWIAHAELLAPGLEGMGHTVGGTDARGYLEQSLRVMQQLGVPAEPLDGTALRKRFPQFQDARIALGLLDTSGGVLFARDVVLALRDLVQGQGVELREGVAAVELAPREGDCGVRLSDGTSLEADVVVLATNAWSGTLLPDLTARTGLRVGELAVYSLQPPPALADQFRSPTLPAFVFAGSGLYGTPLRFGAVKVGDGNPTRMLGRPEERRLAEPAEQARVLDYVLGQLPGLRDAGVVQQRVCIYDLSPDGDFILDQWDAGARLVVACGFSGHGFKFAPLVGAHLARYALSGRRPAALEPFALARFAARRPP